MPANLEKLHKCLEDMKTEYKKDPLGCIRSSSFIYKLHSYCMDELYNSISDAKTKIQKITLDEMKRPSGSPHSIRGDIMIDSSKYQLMPEATLFGSHKNKDEDITLSHFANGPLIAIGVRSQMSSVGNNLENYYEGIIGECISLHDRFPMATLGYVYLLPKSSIKVGKEKETDIKRAEQMFLKITGRSDWHEPNDKYEHFAFLPVDFSTEPVTILATDPEISISAFFDNLIKTHNNRNFFNQL